MYRGESAKVGTGSWIWDCFHKLDAPSHGAAPLAAADQANIADRIHSWP